MLRKIVRLKKFGILDDFSWDSSLPDFCRFNLIYGWNYSGKTTVSRVFRCFETGRLHIDYPEAILEVEDEAGNKFNNSNLTSKSNIRVFNMDFIRDNLKWESEIEPIFILGEESIKLQTDFDIKQKKVAELNIQLDKTRQEKREIKEKIATSLSERAKEIKFSFSIPNYNRTDFSQLVASVQNKTDKFILEEKEKERLFQIYNNQQKMDFVEQMNIFVPDFSYLLRQTQTLSKYTVQSQIIERLKQDSELNNWVKEGKRLHEGKSICEFCGNIIPVNLFDILNKHFSNDYDELIREIDQHLLVLNNSKITSAFIDEARLYPEYRETYIRIKSDLIKKVEYINSSIEQLISMLEEKKRMPFKIINVPQLTDYSEALLSDIKIINELIQDNNSKTEKFESERRKAKELLLYHYASSYCIEFKYLERKKKIQDLDLIEQKLYSELQSSKLEIAEIERQLSETVKGAEKVNKYLKQYFGKDDIAMKATTEKKFKLFRGSYEAKNLSEGEKTAIAFSYFITRLEQKNDDVKNLIIFIDDPVSSLDSNHLFNTYAMIKSKLGQAKQLFISTHNFEFFNLIKDWFSRIKKSEQALYFIERSAYSSRDCSVIKEIHPLLKKFKSEYNFLFSIIYDFHQSFSDDLPKMYYLPNIIRRFLEAFLGFKIPFPGSAEDKLDFIIDDDVDREKVWKFVNYYSHNTTMIKSLVFPNMEECKDVVRIVLESLEKKDKEHYDALVRSLTTT